MSLIEDEQEIIHDSGRFFGEADRKFAGAPRPMLSEMERRIGLWSDLKHQRY
jgi:hypothetical protein